MSDASAAGVLCRSLGWVRARRAELQASLPPPPPRRPRREPANIVAPVAELPAPAPPPPPSRYHIPPRKRRWLLAFWRAGWPTREIAELFDEPPMDLEALFLEARPC